jgi:hypothetical protein
LFGANQRTRAEMRAPFQDRAPYGARCGARCGDPCRRPSAAASGRLGCSLRLCGHLPGWAAMEPTTLERTSVTTAGRPQVIGSTRMVQRSRSDRRGDLVQLSTPDGIHRPLATPRPKPRFLARLRMWVASKRGLDRSCRYASVRFPPSGLNGSGGRYGWSRRSPRTLRASEPVGPRGREPDCSRPHGAGSHLLGGQFTNT